MNVRRKSFAQRVLGAVDLAIDFATLGEYGLEPLPANAGRCAEGSRRERPGHATGWEALATARRGGCTVDDASDRLRLRDLYC
jgi:hypothetical protein